MNRLKKGLWGTLQVLDEWGFYFKSGHFRCVGDDPMQVERSAVAMMDQPSVLLQVTGEVNGAWISGLYFSSVSACLGYLRRVQCVDGLNVLFGVDDYPLASFSASEALKVWGALNDNVP